MSKDDGLQSGLWGVMKCRICRRISMVICASIIVVEAAILLPSYGALKTDLHRILADKAFAALVIAFEGQESASLPGAIAAGEALLQRTDLRGATFYDEDGVALGFFGEPAKTAPEAFSRLVLDGVMLPRESRYEVLWPKGGSGLSYSVVGRIDSSSIPDELRAFVLRIGGLILVISVFVSIAAIAILNGHLLQPLLKIRSRLLAAYNDPVNAEAYRIDASRNDELGDLATALNQLLGRLSEQRRLELADREQRFRDFASASSDWFWEMDEKLRFSFFSDNFEEVTGVPPKMLLGKTREDSGIPNVDPESWSRHLEDLKKRRAFRNFVHPRTKQNGQVVWLSINGKPVFDAKGEFRGYRGTGSDVTKQYAAEIGYLEAKRTAEQASNRLMEAIAAMSDGFALYDSEERLVVCNNRFKEMFPAYAESFVPGAAFESIVNTAAWSGMIKDAMGREEVWIGERISDFRNLKSDFTRQLTNGRWIRVTERRTADGGTVSLRSDVTEAKARETQLREARERAELASRAKSEFLAMMSHEIRTPMNGVLGMANLLSETQLTVEQREFIEIVKSSGDALMVILNDILDLAKIEAERLEIIEGVFDAATLAQNVARLWSGRARDKGLSLEANAPPGLPVRLLGDAGRIQQILSNLVSNAVKFTERGGVTIGLSFEGTEPGCGVLRCDVLDSGIGIPAELQPILFESFTQADTSATRRFGGTGLGLAISKRLTELMGGHIGVHSEPGEGAHFWFTVRCRLAEGEPSVPDDARETADQPPVQRPKPGRVLVAEDNEVNQRVIGLILAGAGYEADVVPNGVEAVAAVLRSPYDVILMDAQMPVMDGISATKKIRNLAGAAARTPIIAVTADAMQGDRDKYLAAGMDDYVAKPIEPADLLNKIGKLAGSPAATANSKEQACRGDVKPENEHGEPEKASRKAKASSAP